MANEISRTDVIEGKVDRPTAGAISVSMQGGLAVQNMAQAMEVAKLMSVSGAAVPAHLRNNPGACLAIGIQGWEWGVNPFAIANKSYVVNDRLAYESALYHAVVLRRAPIQGRLKIEYTGEGMSRKCRVAARLRPGHFGEEGIVDYESPLFSAISPKNSPLWKNDPDQQLFYFSIRAFARRHFPDVMMGVYTVDELQDINQPSNATQDCPKAPGIEEQLRKGEAKTTTSDPRQHEGGASEGFSPSDAPGGAAEDIRQRQIDELKAADEKAAAQTSPPAASTEPPPLDRVIANAATLSWEDFATECRKLAGNAGPRTLADAGEVDRALNGWALKHAKKGKEGTISKASRVEIITAIAEGRMAKDGTIIQQEQILDGARDALASGSK